MVEVPVPNFISAAFTSYSFSHTTLPPLDLLATKMEKLRHVSATPALKYMQRTHCKAKVLWIQFRLAIHSKTSFNSFILEQYHEVRVQWYIEAACSHSPVAQHFALLSSALGAESSSSVLLPPTSSPNFITKLCKHSKWSSSTHSPTELSTPPPQYSPL